MKFPLYTCLLLFAVSCAQPAGAQTKIDADQLEKMVSADSTIQLLDVRTPGELNAPGRIERAIVINFNSPDFQKQLEKLDKEKPFIVYCAAGGRSPKAAAQMVKMGFKKVYDYAGGMNDWKAKGKKTVF